jgi:hypothetical protein
MSTNARRTKTMPETKRAGYFCGPSVYEWGGFEFEVHSYFGPWPHRKDGELRKNIPKGFWDMWERFDGLPLEEKDAARIHQGGCRPICQTVEDEDDGRV